MDAINNLSVATPWHSAAVQEIPVVPGVARTYIGPTARTKPLAGACHKGVQIGDAVVSKVASRIVRQYYYSACKQTSPRGAL